mmetsp:Transcript_25172/g.37415  ORF Transcript_25172/g.37415 Transcript_25172/m.37415 type:complete len:84 (-) Transcript_25172:223-474(-)
MHSRLSRVVPATGVTIAPPDRLEGLRYPIRALERVFFLSLPSLYARFDSLHMSLLNKVDLPAFGGPRIDTMRSAFALLLMVLL